jgi:hypothetical protein
MGVLSASLSVLRNLPFASTFFLIILVTILSILRMRSYNPPLMILMSGENWD